MAWRKAKRARTWDELRGPHSVRTRHPIEETEGPETPTSSSSQSVGSLWAQWQRRFGKESSNDLRVNYPGLRADAWIRTPPQL